MSAAGELQPMAITALYGELAGQEVMVVFDRFADATVRLMNGDDVNVGMVNPQAKALLEEAIARQFGKPREERLLHVEGTPNSYSRGGDGRFVTSDVVERAVA